MSRSILRVYPIGFLVSRLALGESKPADRQRLDQLIKSGNIIARLKFDFAKQKTQAELIKKFKSIIPIIVDLPMIRTALGKLAQRGLVLTVKDKIILAANKNLADMAPDGLIEQLISLNQDISPQIKVSDRIFINHGSVVLVVSNINHKLIYANVTRGGKINSYDDVVVPGKFFDSEIDKTEIIQAAKLKPVYLSLALGKSSQIKAVKKILKNTPSKLIIKLESLKQIKLVKTLIKSADGLLIDNRRLAWEVPQSKLINIQKDLIGDCQKLNKIIMVTDANW